MPGLTEWVAREETFAAWAKPGSAGPLLRRVGPAIFPRGIFSLVNDSKTTPASRAPSASSASGLFSRSPEAWLGNRWIRYFPMLPFVSYLRPYRKQLIASVLCLFCVGFLEPFNIILLKPGFDVILGVERRNTHTLPGVVHESLKPLAVAGRTLGGGAQALRQRLAAPIEQVPEADTIPGSKPGKEEPDELGPLTWVKTMARTFWDERIKPYELWFRDLSKRNPFGALMLIGGILVVATILKGLFEFLSNYILTWVMRRVTIELQTDILHRVLIQDYLFFKEKTTGYLISRIGSDVQMIANVSGNVIRDGLQQPLTLVFLTILLIYLSPEMSILALLVLPIGGIVLYKFGKRLRRITKKSRKESDEQSSMLEEALRNYPIVKTFGTEDREVKRFMDQSEKIFRLNMKGRSIRFGTGPLMEALGALAMSLILLIGGYLVLIKQTLGVSGFMIYLVALTRFYQPIKRLSRLNVRFQEAAVSTERIIEMLAMKPGKTAPREKLEPAEFKKAISLEGVTFGYEKDEPVLRDITLEIPKGSMVALVGPSGSGKTTLLGLLPRLYDPDCGRVLLDGTDLRDLDPGGLRRLLGIVTQETVLFNDTILNNIAYGSEVSDRQKAEQCARAANAHEFILELEKGYDTVIGQSGARLSGGQCQRLAIARALYRDPPILLLDEATSHLDSRSESLVQEAIDRLLEGRTAVVIAHRLSTVRRSDRIVVLEKGRVVEYGTHEELLGRVDLYKDLYDLQTQNSHH